MTGWRMEIHHSGILAGEMEIDMGSRRSRGTIQYQHMHDSATSAHFLELGTSVPGFDSRNERGRAARDAYPLAFSYM